MTVFSAGDPLDRYAGTFPGCTGAVGYATVAYLIHSSDGTLRKSQLQPVVGVLALGTNNKVLEDGDETLKLEVSSQLLNPCWKAS